MENFRLQIPTDIRFGKNRLNELPEVLATYGRRVLFVYGGGSIKASGLYDQVTGLLADNGFKTVELSRIEPNPCIESVREGVKLIRDNELDVILTVGGGSVVDAAKVIAAAVYHDGDAWDLIEDRSLVETAEIKPHVNQILLAPSCPQEEVVAFCREHDILLEAYSPLGTGSIFGNPVAQELATKYGKSVAQVALRWSLQKGFLPLPKSVTPKNIESNLDIFDFELSAEDVAVLDTVEGVTTQKNPDETNF